MLVFCDEISLLNMIALKKITDKKIVALVRQNRINVMPGKNEYA